jgi:arsenite methyltransferase
MSMKARMFNRQASDPKNKPDEILTALAVQPGQKVADIGAGGGYFALRFAKMVGKQGQVYAVDTDSGKIEFIKKSAAKGATDNVQTIVVTAGDLTLPEKVDLIFLRNVYHHLKDRVHYFSMLKSSLKLDGRIAIIEHKGGSIFEHRVNKETIVEEMRQAGYQVAKSLDFLPKQSFTIFSLKQKD